MYRLIFRTVNTARNASVSVCESCAFPAPALRATSGGGVKALSTSSVKLCEKTKDVADVASSSQEEKTNAVESVDPKESPALVTQKAEEDTTQQQEQQQQQQQQQVDVKTEEVVAATPIQVKQTVAPKSGKESLLDLLGAMKVEVTNKRKLKNLKVKPTFEATPKAKPAAMESTISMFQKATEEASSQSETLVSLDPELISAATAAASTLPHRKQAESELLRQLRQHEAVTEAQKKGDGNDLGVIISEMKVGKNPNRQNTWPHNQIQFDDDGRGYTQDRGITAELDGVRRRRNLFSGKRLNIFSPTTGEDGVESTAARPTLWDLDFAYQLSASANHMPRNGLEEMIEWTKEGKMWQYPINNEAGLEEEASVSFHEHIFLEKHLEEGFPRQGPVRHFMELVVAGLSRNPYVTVQQKKEHISWFRDYFHQKEDVLKEADVYLN